MRGVNKDMRQLLKKAKQRGWEVERTRGDHIRLRKPDHRNLVTSLTPSKPSALRNFWAELKRAEKEYESGNAKGC